MKTLFLDLLKLFSFLIIIALIKCTPSESGKSKYSDTSMVVDGTPVGVMLTSYSTTLIANGKDNTMLRITIIDKNGKEITSAENDLDVYVKGSGYISNTDESKVYNVIDSSGVTYAKCKLANGVCNLKFVAGTIPDVIKIEVKSDSLWTAGHEIHTVPADFVQMKPTSDQLPETKVYINKMIGADISFLPEMEAKGKKFYDGGEEIEAIQLLKNHGFNFIRLRIFVNPENKNGYSPEIGYCGLAYTLKMAKRVKDANMKILLDFHYSDYWADPQKQFKPEAWEGLNFEQLKDSVKNYTSRVLMAMKEQGTMPDMVQVGNEINHGMIWPDGHISNPDGLAALLISGVEGVKKVDSNVPIMMHIALGGINDESVFWLDNMIARGVEFDIIGISYYPRWHGTLDDLNSNANDLVSRYNKPLNIVEYSDYKKEVHDIVFGLPDNMGKGACIWEPLSWGRQIISEDGKTIESILVYDSLSELYLNRE